ncbi:MAG: class I SAM-dependent methyltransferase [Halobacteriales archaeon]
MKGQEWYQEPTIAAEYESKRFSRGGRLIDRREKAVVFDALGTVEGRSVLDIAAGTGRFSVALADRGAEVVSVDISQAMLGQAREKTRARSLAGTINFLRGDASALPFPDDAFDAVVAMRFFHLVDDPVPFLEELRRVAADRVVFDTFRRRSARSLYTWALPMGSRLAAPAEVHGWLDAAALEVERAEHDWLLPYGFYRAVPLALARAVRPIDDRLVRSPGLSRLATVSYWTAAVP